MKPYAKLLLLAAVLGAALLPSAKAQLVTYETISAYDGSSLTGFSNTGVSATRFETFTNIDGIASLTYNFFKSGASSSAATFSATFSEWNSSNSTWTSLVNFGSFTVPASTSWTTMTNGHGTFATFAQSFDFGGTYATDATKTYALLLTNTTGSNTNFGIGTVFDSFAYGSTAVVDTGNDYTFSQIVVVPHVTPVPEASTVAALIGGALAVGLAAMRIRQRKQLAAAPVAA